MPLVSVICPCFRDWGRARLLVAAVLEQTLDDFEMVLVNNDPDDPRPTDFPSDPRIRHLDEWTRGSYAARNRGAAAAQGKFLAFTDSDCIPEPDWLEMLVDRAHTHEGMISGKVSMFSVRGALDRLNWAEAYDYYFGINQARYARDGVAATANLFVPRSMFASVGGFDASLMSGGDVDFCRRVARFEGGPEPLLCYCDAAIVRHPLRASLREVLIKARRVAGGRAERDGWRSLLIVLAPPLVRLQILVETPSPGGWASLKALVLVVRVKLLEVAETLAILFLGKQGAR